MTTTDDLIKNFERLGHRDARYQYVIDVAEKLPEMPEKEKTVETFMKGCGSNDGSTRMVQKIERAL